MALALGLAVAGTTLALHPDDSVGIGAVFGFGGGSGGGFFNPGISLKLPAAPIYWGIFALPIGKFGLGLTFDYYALSGNLLNRVLENEDGIYNLRLNGYLGIGGFASFFLGDASFVALGLRLPIGLSWPIVRQAELALGIVPGIGMSIGAGRPRFYGTLGGELAIRYWFAPAANSRAE